MKYNEKIVALRKANGFTQEGFAREVGVTRQAVYKWEVGDSYPEAEKLMAIKALFGISIDDLLDDAFDVIIEKPKKAPRRKTLPPVREFAPAAEAAPAPAPAVAPVAPPVPAPAPAPAVAPVVEPVPAPAPAPAVAPVVEPVPAPAPAPAVAPVAPVAEDDLDEFDFEVTENANKGAEGNLFDIFLKK